jgi:hypothetical protein
MSICGLLLLASVVIPVTGMYESQTADMEADIAGNLASLIDDFSRSDMDVFTVSMSDILPSVSSYVEFGERVITLTTERGVYRSGTYVTITTNGCAFGYGDILRLSKDYGTVIAEKLS